jgi:hypothetical protein
MALNYPNETLLAGIAAAERYADGLAQVLEPHTISTDGLRMSETNFGVFQASHALDQLLNQTDHNQPSSFRDDPVAQITERTANAIAHFRSKRNESDRSLMGSLRKRLSRLWSPIHRMQSELFSIKRRVQAELLRCIFGNPFSPVTPEPAWRTSNAVGLAQAIYDDRAFDRMPILSDALEDAGCTNEGILNHCRQPGVHVRGCWVIDLILGKE